MSKNASVVLGLVLLVTGCGAGTSSGKSGLKTSRRSTTTSSISSASTTPATAVAPVVAPVVAKPVSFAGCDAAIQAFMSARSVPGGTFALVKDGRLVYAKGYGTANTRTRAAARPETPFRLASLSKHFTAVAVMQLVQQGRFTLDTPAFSLLPHLPVLPGAFEDSRLGTVTIRRLLDHTGGWDWDVTDDPLFDSVRIARAAGVASPPSADVIVRYVRGRRLDYTPGSKYVYANIDFCILGRVIERVSGLSYDAYMQRNVLAPSGIVGMRLGRSFERDALAGEASYEQPDELGAQNVFDPQGALVPWAYGGFSVESFDSAGGWVATAVDVARFEAALSSNPSPLLAPASLAALYARPPGAPGQTTPGGWYYAGGEFVTPAGHGGADYVHDGSFPGTATYVVRRGDGVSWVTLFNKRSNDSALLDEAIEVELNDAVDKLAGWPSVDLFPSYP